MSDRVEDRLFQNRYVVDVGRPHITVRPHETPSQALLVMTRICPAGCYSQNEQGQVEVAADGCMECGTCRVVCSKTGDIEWQYPRGGYGVLFKFG
ncbi:ferredoxin-like protein [Gluconacetobacter diazotrophicus PA1 5]|uniref:Ferredoxin-like protein n=2 Tax=Gluconacetobacter diazotrophicus TaxID=33996 RepID=A9H605_GLUDA|nr:ferredoxin family protein [Gluconacetobacter diazotrophicus]AAG27080.2 FixX [Gluconacetobacter diazotrophicus PA1 5]ACI51331.1 ferredoxin-like protein [Gluconacetobacter diazotrophicus PA1 5]MBB2157424.1 ferredoxin family protein [Gluconacetobacter diazotrophicus]TWB09879.1 ferredoxin like protein [Gluconacetobacter diazotrophicus]CAP54397.1 Ferredoxin-like protein [Gluconacetobacter diazotrophicus PA1 5]